MLTDDRRHILGGRVVIRRGAGHARSIPNEIPFQRNLDGRRTMDDRRWTTTSQRRRHDDDDDEKQIFTQNGLKRFEVLKWFACNGLKRSEMV